jgi:hypothetical protein
MSHWKAGGDVSIEYTAQKCRFIGDFPKQQIKDALQLRVPGYIHTKAYKEKRWDGFHNYLSTATGVFPTGMLPQVYFMLKKGYNPLSKFNDIVIPGVPLRINFRFVDGSLDYFNLNFVRYYIDNPQLEINKLIHDNAESLTLRQIFSETMIRNFFSGPSQKLPASVFTGYIDGIR